MLFDIAFYIGFLIVCFFIVRWRENQFNLEENEHNVEKLTVKFWLPTGMCQHFKSLSKASMKNIQTAVTSMTKQRVVNNFE